MIEQILIDHHHDPYEKETIDVSFITVYRLAF